MCSEKYSQPSAARSVNTAIGRGPPQEVAYPSSHLMQPKPSVRIPMGIRIPPSGPHHNFFKKCVICSSVFFIGLNVCFRCRLMQIHCTLGNKYPKTGEQEINTFFSIARCMSSTYTECYVECRSYKFNTVRILKS